MGDGDWDEQKHEAWRNFVDRTERLGEVLTYLHDEIDVLTGSPDCAPQVRERAADVKRRLALLAGDVNWISDAAEVPGLVTAPEQR